MTTFSSHPELEKFESIFANVSVKPSDRTVLIAVCNSVMFCVRTVSSVKPLGVSVPSPKKAPKMIEGSIANSNTGNMARAIRGIIHFFALPAAASAAP